MRTRHALALVLGVAVATLSCTGPTPAPSRTTPRVRALVVGTNGDSPPFAFRRGDQVVGLEIDLAGELGKALGRPVDILDLPWGRLPDALLAGQVDVIMAGMTATSDRAVRMAFSEPYMRSTIAALIRRQDRERFKSRDAVCTSPIDVGVVAGTTGEKYIRSRCPAMLPRLYPTARDAVLELRRFRIDAVAHDGPVLLWLLSQYEAELEIVPTRIADEPIAWAFRPDNVALRDAANAAIARMRADGTLERLLERWIPLRGRLSTD